MSPLSVVALSALTVIFFYYSFQGTSSDFRYLILLLCVRSIKLCNGSYATCLWRGREKCSHKLVMLLLMTGTSH